MNPPDLQDHAVPWSVVAVVACAGLAARVWVVRHSPGVEYAVDQLFDTLAWNLVSVHRFTLDGVSPAAHVGPLYPVVLALFYAVVGHRPEWVPVLHVACDVGTGFCVYRVGSLLWGSREGGWAAALVFLYPAYWTYDARIRSESFLTFLVSAWLWAALVCLRTPSMIRYGVAGVLAGLTILCKPAALPLAGMLAGVPFIGARTLAWIIPRVSFYVALCVLLVAPWSIRNYVTFHELIPVSAGIGAGIWMGSDPVTRGSWPMPLEQEHTMWESAGITPLPHPHYMYEVAVDKVLFQKGLHRIQADPVGYSGLVLRRIWDFWIGNSFYLINAEEHVMHGLLRDAEERGWAVAIYSLLKRVLVVPALVAMAAWSAWYFRARWRAYLPVMLFPVGLMAGYVPFTVEAGRYALPVLPCLIVLSVALVAHLQDLRSSLVSRPSSPQTVSASCRTN